MGKRTGRKRGAPYGNTNRLTHGGYTALAIAKRRVRAAALSDGLLLSDAVLLLERVDRLENVLTRVARSGVLGEL